MYWLLERVAQLELAPHDAQERLELGARRRRRRRRLARADGGSLPISLVLWFSCCRTRSAASLHTIIGSFGAAALLATNTTM